MQKIPKIKSTIIALPPINFTLKCNMIIELAIPPKSNSTQRHQVATRTPADEAEMPDRFYVRARRATAATTASATSRSHSGAPLRCTPD